ncbi:aminoglycoside phosphotransferase family protein [Kitasatospora sp. NPDC050543]|uniref:aminoglycoside phosphotransferase family protein n=1 Tax=Kitasatospora sp. NPDC050543 TaxID=3364054 RepID=UPI0037B293CB
MSPAPGQISIPARLAHTVTAEEGEAARSWLTSLPERVAAHLARWDLTLERVLEPGGRRSLIGYAHRDDLSAVALKATLPAPEPSREHAALAHWAGRGAVLLLDSDPAEGVLLLERLHGEIPLRSLAEAKAMLEATSLLRRLWVPLTDGHGFTPLADHAAVLLSGLRRRCELPAAADARPLADAALEAAEVLLSSATEQFLLHGNFHHGKVLAADRAPWLAVAPEPLAGERAYDLARLAQDRIDTLVASPGPRGAARRRLQQLAEAVEVDHDRLRGWTLLRSVDTGLRHLEAGDTGSAELYLEFADWL